MATASLNAKSRSESGKGAARSLRRNGEVPAVVYGHAREPQSLSVNSRELDKLLQHITAESTVVELSLDGGTSRTLIREIQRHPFKNVILHVDFQELVAGEAVSVRVPIVLVGTPEGVRNSGGVLDQLMRELAIEVDPANIPNHIDVDVTGLAVGHTIHVSDVTLPEGVTVVDDGGGTICVVSVPKVSTATEVTEEVAAPGEPELIRKPKPEEGSEAGEK